ncbi:MAG TPA: phosphopantetheine-binding protein [Steroidobacteraceae bacterium]|nr:phosphopantetheine-binding protein [Steroidobacteraceae bacterium]
MNDMDELKQSLKAMIVEECDKDIDPGTITNDEQLIGGGSLGLDSLDALQISLAVQQRYGVRIEDGPKARKVLRNIDALAAAIVAERHSMTSYSSGPDSSERTHLS